MGITVESRRKRGQGGAKLHLVPDGELGPSMLILGSEEYDVGIHDRALCGYVTEFGDPQQATFPQEVCQNCLRAKVARHVDEVNPTLPEVPAQ